MSLQWLVQVGHLGYEAWQWLVKPGTSPLGTIIAAAVAGYISYLAGKRVAKTNATNAAAQARIDQKQKRLAEAYPSVVELTSRSTLWATFSLSPLRTGTEPRRPRPPDAAETIAARTALYSFGSREVQARFETFMACVFAVEDMEERVAREQGARSRRESSGTWDPRDGVRELDDTLRPAVVAAQQRLQAAVSAELQG